MNALTKWFHGGPVASMRQNVSGMTVGGFVQMMGCQMLTPLALRV